MEISAYLSGGLSKWPTKYEMVNLLETAGLHVVDGKYSIRLKDFSRFILQEYGGDIGEPQIDACAESVEKMIQDAKKVSDVLANAKIKHRFEIYSSDDEMVEYMHFDWPQ